MTIYEALCRELPFPREGHPQLRMDPRPLPGRVWAPVADATMACLERRPEDRPTAEQLADALEPLVGSLPPRRIGRFRPGATRLMRELELGSPA